MSTAVIVMGAAGRMGSTLTRLVAEQNDMNLAGAVERKEAIGALGGLNCPVRADVGALLADTPGAVIVDFTSPEASLATARAAREVGAAHVIGTTGFSAAQKEELETLAAGTPVFWSPNMSVGVNVLLKVLPMLTRLLGESYDLEMVELHHNKKKDAPSGTALRLAECLAEARNWRLEDTARCCREGLIGARPEKEIGIQTVRGGDVVGVHTAYFMGPGERIEVTHQAHSRENFAGGALRAARWLAGQKPGKLYNMQDMLI
ncbi:MAG: 4-hydroxy-tetrahydrodipicolinate reductase [Desulfovibrio sp.]|jgi:4-hydroxy-tetrahydrodipicolinate reductase|nr:4-hydroxy-tetrahydrodipicolinate reductase [Desulfovibrio sp.]